MCLVMSVPEYGVQRCLVFPVIFLKGIFRELQLLVVWLGTAKTPELFRSRSGGYIYVCQQGALNYFHPDSIMIDPAPTVQFTAVQVFKTICRIGRPFKNG